MQHTPIIMLCGSAGSGKDTAAQFIKDLIPRTELIAQARPLKELGQDLFGFNQDQLYGPSEYRNAPDPRFDKEETWKAVEWDQEIIQFWLGHYFKGYEDVNTKFKKWLADLKAQTYAIGKQLTPRLMLQTLGTEFGRAVDPAVWPKIALRDAQYSLFVGKSDLVVITDGRFKNEILHTKLINGMTVLIDAPNTQSIDAAGVAGHASEAELKSVPRFWYDKIILNEKARGMDHYKATVNAFCHYLTAAPNWFD